MSTPVSEQSILLANAVERVFHDAGDAAARAEAVGWQSALWSQIQALGLPLTLLPESAGGFGASWDDAYVILRTAGYYNIPLPLAESMLAQKLLTAVGLQPLEGSISLASRTEGTLASGGTGCRFSGTLYAVPWGRDVDRVVAFAALGTAPQLFVVDGSAVDSCNHAHNLALEPRDDLEFIDAPVTVHPFAAVDHNRAADLQTLLRAAQMAGCLGSILDRTVEYAKARVQFGRPISQFQIVQQQLALLGEEAAATDCAVQAAFRAAWKSDCRFEIGCAKLRANTAVGIATAIAHQVHAAIGLTREYPLRHSTQRLLSWRSEYGNDRYWADYIGRDVIARGAASYWSDITARGDVSAGVTIAECS